MSVSDVINLQTGDHAGAAIVNPRRFRPLGGNGFHAPSSMYEVGISIAGDASAGNAQLIISPDDRFEQLLALVQVSMTSATGAIEVFFQMSTNNVFTRGFVDAAPLDGINSFNNAVWNPPPLLGFDEARVVTLNPGVGPVLTTFWYVYNFNIQASKKVPMYQLLANLPRSGTAE